MTQASAEKLSILGLPKRKEWPQCHKESSWQGRRSHPCQKEKEQSCLSKAPNREVGESQNERELHLEERKRKIKAGAWRGMDGL